LHSTIVLLLYPVFFASIEMRISAIFLILIFMPTRAEIFDTDKSTLSGDAVSATEEKSLPPDLPVFTLETLRMYNGSDSSLPILLGLKGMVFDVTSGSKFYGRGMGYANFAGRDVTRNTAMFSTKNRDLDRVDYPPEKQASLDSKSPPLPLGSRSPADHPLTGVYRGTYVKKYPIVGTLVNTNTAPPHGTEHEKEEDEMDSRGPILLTKPPPPPPPPPPASRWVLTAVGGLAAVIFLFRLGLIDISHFLG
jgi:predicted heme/steroid binding protein